MPSGCGDLSPLECKACRREQAYVDWFKLTVEIMREIVAMKAEGLDTRELESRMTCVGDSYWRRLDEIGL